MTRFMHPLLKRLLYSTSGLVAVVTALLATVSLLIAFVAYDVTHEALEEQLDHRISTETAVLTAEAGLRGVKGVAAAVRQRDASRSTSSLDYLVTDQSGNTLAGSLITQVPVEGYEEFLNYRVADGSRSGVAQAITTRLNDGMLIVAADRKELSEIDRTLARLFSSALAAMLATGVMSAIFIGWITRKRLAKIDETAHAIIGGDLLRRIPRDYSLSEFDRLAGTLNEMLCRINALMDNLSQVSTDVAHDLRTPLTRLSNHLDQAVSAKSQDDTRQAVTAARAEATTLLELFAAMLRIAEIEGMAERLPRQTLNLSALVEQMVETYQPTMDDEQRSFKLQCEQNLWVNGDARLLSQLLANLLDNCLSHTPAGTAIEVVLTHAEGKASLLVRDHGPGVALADGTRLFERFVRGEKSRSTAGHGLGLAIVKSIATAHGGSAQIASSQPFEVVVELPLSVDFGN